MKPGMNVPVDGLVVRGHDVSTNESSITAIRKEMRKEPLSQCLLRKEEILEEAQDVHPKLRCL